MVSDHDSYDLGELSVAAGVTPRTVRYYVQQGLLPTPGTRGPGTRYDGAYLDRLRLIRRLQREHLPLAEIRRRLEMLDDAGIRDALVQWPDPTESSALDYVRSLLARQASRTAAERPVTFAAPMMTAVPSPPEPPARGQSNAIFGGAPSRGIGGHPLQPPAGAPSPTQSSRSTRSTWEHIPLAPDVELHVRRPLSREQNRQVERLLEAARDLFAEEP